MNPVKRTGPNDCAFPLTGVFGGTGITAREWFAGMALIGILGNGSWNRLAFMHAGIPEGECYRAAAAQAFMYADALMASPGKRKEVKGGDSSGCPGVP